MEKFVSKFLFPLTLAASVIRKSLISKNNISSNKWKSQKEKRVISRFLSYLHVQTLTVNQKEK